MSVYINLKLISALSVIFLAANGLEFQGDDLQAAEPPEAFAFEEVHSRNRRDLNITFRSSSSSCTTGAFKHDPKSCKFFYKCVKFLFLYKWQKFKCVFGCYDVINRSCMKNPSQTCRDLPYGEGCKCPCSSNKPPTTTSGPIPTIKPTTPTTIITTPDPHPGPTTGSPVPTPKTTSSPIPEPTEEPGIPNPCPPSQDSCESGEVLYQFGDAPPPTVVTEIIQVIPGTTLLSGVPYRIAPYDSRSNLRSVESPQGHLILQTTVAPSLSTCDESVVFKFFYVGGKLILVNLKYSAVLMGGNAGSHQKEGDVVGEVAMIEDDKWICGDGRNNFYCKNQAELGISLREDGGKVFISMKSEKYGKSIWYGQRGNDKPVKFKEEPAKVGNNHAFVFNIDCSCSSNKR